MRIALLHLCGLHATAASCELGWAWGGARGYQGGHCGIGISSCGSQPDPVTACVLLCPPSTGFNSSQHGATGSDPCAGFPFLNRAQITSRTHVPPWLAEMKEQAVETSLILVGDADLNGIHSVALGRSCHCADSGLGYMALARATRLRALGPGQTHKMVGLLPCNFCAAT